MSFYPMNKDFIIIILIIIIATVIIIIIIIIIIINILIFFGFMKINDKDPPLKNTFCFVNPLINNSLSSNGC